MDKKYRESHFACSLIILKAYKKISGGLDVEKSGESWILLKNLQSFWFWCQCVFSSYWLLLFLENVGDLLQLEFELLQG